MKNTLLLPFLLLACPAQLDSVDGLGGGELTSALKAPSLVAEEVTAQSLEADAVVTQLVTASSVSSGDITSSTRVTAPNFLLERGATRVSLQGLVVGAAVPSNEQGTAADGTTPNYFERHRACADAFPSTETLPAAHVCSAAEAVAHAMQSDATLPAEANGGLVHAYSAGVFDTIDGVIQLQNDCNGIGSLVTARNSHGLELVQRELDGIWSLRHHDCTGGERYLCCQ